MAQARSYDLIVIGSGAAGGVAAQLAAADGKKVALIEGDAPGGSVPTYGSVPIKALLSAAGAYQSAKASAKYGIRASSVAYNYPSIYAWKEKAITSTGVRDDAYQSDGIDLIEGWAEFTGKHSVRVNDYELTAGKFLIATGSHDLVPHVKGLADAGFMTGRQILDLKSAPKSLAIVGGGPSAVEFAELFSSFGSEVRLIHSGDRLLPSEDADVSHLVEQILENKGVHVYTDGTLIEADHGTRKKKTLSLTKNGEQFDVSIDEILIANNRAPNIKLNLEAAKVAYTKRGVNTNDFLQTSNKRIFAAGDVTGVGWSAQTAIYQGRLAYYNMFNRRQAVVSYETIPHSIDIWPEVASVGISEQDVAGTKVKYQAVSVPLSVAAKSFVTGEDVGFVKIIADPSGYILGASIIGPRASDMIHELALAMQMDIRVQDIAALVHVVPSWSDAVRIACSNF